MKSKKVKLQKVKTQRKAMKIKPAVNYTLIAVGFILIVAVLSVFHFLFRSGRIKLTESYREVLLRLQSSYRNATAVVEARCIDSHTESNGKTYSSFVINEVLSGENGFEKDMNITVQTPCSAGETHLIYIKSPDNETGSGVVFSVVDENNYLIEKEKIIIDSRTSIPYSVFKTHIKEIRKEILMPSQYFFYRSFSSLVNNSDLIVIGKLISIEKEEKVSCLTMENGEEQNRTLSVTTFEVEILNGLGSGKSYGERIIIKIPQKNSIPMLDFITNKNYYTVKENYQLEKDNICLFFLKRCKDHKEPLFFLINEYQGYVRTNGDFITPADDNLPFREYLSLPDAVDSIMKEKNR